MKRIFTRDSEPSSSLVYARRENQFQKLSIEEMYDTINLINNKKGELYGNKRK